MRLGFGVCLAGAIMQLVLTNCSHVAPVVAYGYAEEDVTGSIVAQSQQSEMFAPLSIPKTKKHVYLLLGGLKGRDGWLTSAGMFGLRSSLAALPDVEVTTYEWASFKKAADDIASLPPDDIVIVIGYSGGAAKATWLANGYFGDARNALPHPRIDLMVLYDPSPTWSMMPIHDNVKRAICYRNVAPLFFGLGGAALVGKNTRIETVDIFEPHLLVQINSALHQRTIDEVKNIQNYRTSSGPFAEAGYGAP
jgi:hypothetical protein